ncbi:hypothetical protein [Pectinatus frisingensis]|uniref:hypothetical protein n=1 Tax=Pectinatus frisingensis TaxID=865 RepID=UPI0015F4B30F|nr:hypothetical protein [Pectinatus frisingensis]
MKLKAIAGGLLSLFLFSGMVFAAEGGQSPDKQTAWTLTKGTVIPVEAIESVSSKNCRKGQKVFFKLKSDVKSEGEIIIPANTLVEATVIKVKRTGPWDSSGEVDLVFSEIKAKNGQSVPIDGKLDVKGKKPNFFVRYSLLGVLIAGRNVTVEKGTTVDLKVADDVSSLKTKENTTEGIQATKQ